MATAVVTFMANRSVWTGTASLLLEMLTAVVSERVARSQVWPTAPHVLSGHLRRAAPNLRKIGIDVSWSKGHNEARMITIQKKSAHDEPQDERKLASSASAASSPSRPGSTHTPGDGQDAPDAQDAVLLTQPGGSRARFSPNPLKSQNGGTGGAEVKAKGEGANLGPGKFIDAQGKATDDPEEGYYGRTARAQFEEACEAAAGATPEIPETPPEAEKQPETAPAPEKQPDAVADMPEPDFGPRPTLPGDLQRWLQKKRNWEASKRAEAEMKGRLH